MVDPRSRVQLMCRCGSVFPGRKRDQELQSCPDSGRCVCRPQPSVASPAARPAASSPAMPAAQRRPAEAAPRGHASPAVRTPCAFGSGGAHTPRASSSGGASARPSTARRPSTLSRVRRPVSRSPSPDYGDGDEEPAGLAADYGEATGSDRMLCALLTWSVGSICYSAATNSAAYTMPEKLDSKTQVAAGPPNSFLAVLPAQAQMVRHPQQQPQRSAQQTPRRRRRRLRKKQSC